MSKSMRVQSRKLWSGTAILAMAAVLVSCGAKSGPPPPPSGSGPLGDHRIPIAVATAPGGDLRMVISISVASGPTIPVLLDTGSTGLRVFQSAIGTHDLAMTDTSDAEDFGTGFTLSGHHALAPVSIGSLSTTGPIMIQVIQSATCTASAPNCPATSGLTGVASNIGAQGIMGIGLEPDEVFSPLLQLQGGVPTSYSINYANSSGYVGFGQNPGTASASLKIPVAAPPSQSNGAPAWDDQAIPACWTVGTGHSTCAPTVFDTGSPATSFPSGFSGIPNSAASGTRLASGQQVSISSSETAKPFWTFRSSGELGNGIVAVRGGEGLSQISSGLTFFRQYQVTFQLAKGTIEFSPPP